VYMFARLYISETTCQSFPNFMYMLFVVVAWSSYADSSSCHILPVL